MILHAVLTFALSVTAAFSADSVRAAAKQVVALPDSVLLTLPAPAIKAPTLVEPRIAVPVTLAWPSKHQETPLAQAAAVVTASIQSVSQPARVEVAQRSAEVVQQAATAKTSAMILAAATPPDASAVALPLRSAMPAAPAKPVTTADGRVVLGTRSTVTIEPLHAVPLPVIGVRLPAPALSDSIVVYKRERTLTLYLRGVPVRSYFVALGSRPVGDKVSAGDDRTPEGLFSINAHNPASKYHLALRISYPDAFHRDRAAKLGVDPGGDIMIHGLPLKFSDAGKDHRLDDWTNGCVALTNQEIEEIWHAVPDGTPIQIKP
ncbi:MAG: L,D-transpeptidase family protein [bacterium]